MAKKDNKASAKNVVKGAAKGAGGDAAAKLVQDITNRYRVTAREARDIVTAVGNVGTNVLFGKKSMQEGRGKIAKNIARQVKETATAAATGKKGTTSDRIGTSVPKSEGGRYGDLSIGYVKGKKRK